MRSGAAAVLALGVTLAACAPGEPQTAATETATTEATVSVELAGSIPAVDTTLDQRLREAVDVITADPIFLARVDYDAFREGDDARVAWALADVLRIQQGGPEAPRIGAAIGRLTGLAPDAGWVATTNALLAADLPAYPGYLDDKRAIHLAVDSRWAPFFVDGADLDWREVAWGGVLRDAIPHLNDPGLEDAASDWIPDDEVVFGVAIGDDARAYPRRVMEVHELVNDTLGGIRIALPYCTLCGAAIAYRADTVPGLAAQPGEFRTSGLLQRSNKLMYEATTESLFDQFLGVGLSGPLQGAELERLAVTTTTWGEWRAAHPATTIVARDARGRPYDADPLGGRDDAGPIFPIGDRDARLPVHELVVGVETPRGQAVAFPVAEARAALAAGETVAAEGVAVRLAAGGLVVGPAGGGPDLPSHQAFWFAWSQFRPDTVLWRRADG